ncbi:MAG: alpha/beta hydrolase [Dehalococcoidia bacterium]|nr:alpha/beta hydrolase [Dehalococcoidia bacterium]
MASLTTNDGAALSYTDQGNGRPIFLFVHGWATDRSIWDPQVEDLSHGYRCIAIDLRGRGESSPVPPFGIQSAVHDIGALIEHLGVGPVIVVGHDLGGIIALELNRTYPQFVCGIVMADPPLNAAEDGRLARNAEAIREEGSTRAFREAVDTFFSSSTPHDVREQVRKLILDCPADIAAGMFDGAENLPDELRDLIRRADDKPFMALWSMDPVGDPDELRRFTMFLRQEPVANGGHFLQLDQPKLTNALIRSFVDDVIRDPRLEQAGIQPA